MAIVNYLDSLGQEPDALRFGLEALLILIAEAKA